MRTKEQIIYELRLRRWELQTYREQLPDEASLYEENRCAQETERIDQTIEAINAVCVRASISQEEDAWIARIALEEARGMPDLSFVVRDHDPAVVGRWAESMQHGLETMVAEELERTR